MNERERDGDGVGRAYATITANKTGNKDQEDGAAEQDNAFPLNVVQTAITKAKQTTQTAITSVSKKKKKTHRSGVRAPRQAFRHQHGSSLVSGNLWDGAGTLSPAAIHASGAPSAQAMICCSPARGELHNSRKAS